MRTMRIEKPPDCRIMLSCLSMDELSPIVWPSCVKTSMHLLKDLYYIITLHYLYYVKGGVLYSLGLYLPITYYCTFLFHCWKVQVILLYKDSFLTTKWGGGGGGGIVSSRTQQVPFHWQLMSKAIFATPYAAWHVLLSSKKMVSFLFLMVWTCLQNVFQTDTSRFTKEPIQEWLMMTCNSDQVWIDQPSVKERPILP